MEIVEAPKILKPAEVSIKTLDGSVIEGKVNLGYENRMSDLLTKTDNPFIVVFDAMYVGSPKKKAREPTACSRKSKPPRSPATRSFKRSEKNSPPDKSSSTPLATSRFSSARWPT